MSNDRCRNQMWDFFYCVFGPGFFFHCFFSKLFSKKLIESSDLGLTSRLISQSCDSIHYQMSTSNISQCWRSAFARDTKLPCEFSIFACVKLLNFTKLVCFLDNYRNYIGVHCCILHVHEHQFQNTPGMNKFCLLHENTPLGLCTVLH